MLLLAMFYLVALIAKGIEASSIPAQIHMEDHINPLLYWRFWTLAEVGAGMHGMEMKNLAYVKCIYYL